VPLDVDLIEVTNRSLSITWREPMSPNGASTYYQVFRSNDTNVWATTETTKVKLSFVTACVQSQLVMFTVENNHFNENFVINFNR
jgi:hypothetical protein